MLILRVPKTYAEFNSLIQDKYPTFKWHITKRNIYSYEDGGKICWLVFCVDESDGESAQFICDGRDIATTPYVEDEERDVLNHLAWHLGDVNSVLLGRLLANSIISAYIEV